MALTGVERTRRYRARLRGENVPKLKPGPRKGYKQTEDHIQAVKNAVQSGENHHLWKGNNVTKHRGNMRAQEVYRLPEKCNRCSNTPIDRHHIDRDTTNNHPDNIEFLCRSCHVKEHRSNN